MKKYINPKLSGSEQIFYSPHLRDYLYNSIMKDIKDTKIIYTINIARSITDVMLYVREKLREED